MFQYLVFKSKTEKSGLCSSFISGRIAFYFLKKHDNLIWWLKWLMYLQLSINRFVLRVKLLPQMHILVLKGLYSIPKILLFYFPSNLTFYKEVIIIFLVLKANRGVIMSLQPCLSLINIIKRRTNVIPSNYLCSWSLRLSVWRLREDFRVTIFASITSRTFFE